MTLSEPIAGMRTGHTIRNIALGVVDHFVVMGVIGTVASASEESPATATIPVTPISAPDGGSASTATTNSDMTDRLDDNGRRHRRVTSHSRS